MERRKVVEDFVPGADDQVELTVCFEWHGHPCKSRFDWYTGEDVWDLKTCRDASPRGFKGAINSFRYFQQAAFYLHGTGMKDFYFIAVSKNGPMSVAVYKLRQSSIDKGKVSFNIALSDYKKVINAAPSEYEANFGKIVEI